MMTSLIKNKKWILGIAAVLLISLGLGLGLGLGLKKDSNDALKQELIETKKLLITEKKLIATKQETIKANEKLVAQEREKNRVLLGTQASFKVFTLKLGNEIKEKEEELKNKQEEIKRKKVQLDWAKKNVKYWRDQDAFSRKQMSRAYDHNVNLRKQKNKEIKEIKLDRDTYFAEAESINEMLEETREKIKALEKETGLLKEQIWYERQGYKLLKTKKEQLERTQDSLQKFILQLENEIKEKEEEIKKLATYQEADYLREIRQLKSDKDRLKVERNALSYTNMRQEKIIKEQAEKIKQLEADEKWEWEETDKEEDAPSREWKTEKSQEEEWEWEETKEQKIKRLARDAKEVIKKLHNKAGFRNYKLTEWQTSGDSAVSSSPNYINIPALKERGETLDLSGS